MPGIYDVTSIPLVSLTLAIFLCAEFGFFGVLMATFVQTPRFWGDERSVEMFLIVFVLFWSAGDLDL